MGVVPSKCKIVCSVRVVAVGHVELSFVTFAAMYLCKICIQCLI